MLNWPFLVPFFTSTISSPNCLFKSKAKATPKIWLKLVRSNFFKSPKSLIPLLTNFLALTLVWRIVGYLAAASYGAAVAFPFIDLIYVILLKLDDGDRQF